MQHPARTGPRVPVPHPQMHALIDPQTQPPPQRRRHIIPRRHQKPPPPHTRQTQPPRREQQLNLTLRRRNPHPHPGKTTRPVELINRLHHRPTRDRLNVLRMTDLHEHIEAMHSLRHLATGLRPRTPGTSRSQPAIHIPRPHPPHRHPRESQQIPHPRPLPAHPPVRRTPSRQRQHKLIHPPQPTQPQINTHPTSVEPHHPESRRMFTNAEEPTTPPTSTPPPLTSNDHTRPNLAHQVAPQSWDGPCPAPARRR